MDVCIFWNTVHYQHTGFFESVSFKVVFVPSSVQDYNWCGNEKKDKKNGEDEILFLRGHVATILYMPSRFVIRGGNPLGGDVTVSGAKNAVTPILAATLLIKGPCVLSNVPRLSDVERMLDILRSLGASVEWKGEHDLVVDTTAADISSIDAKAVKSMRSSVLLLGPLLSRFQEVSLPEPGGCNLGNRPVDTHMYALGKLGAEVMCDKSGYTLRAKKLKGTKVVLPEFSVTATENVIMAAVLAEGRTEVRLAASEPHVQDLCRFLVAAGARIVGIGTHDLIIEGVKELHPVSHRIIPDQIETGTFAVLGAFAKAPFLIHGVAEDQLDIILVILQRAGVSYTLDGDTLTVFPSRASLTSFKLQTLPWPGFPTDLQAPFGVLATQSRGTTLIHDPLYDGRFGYITELCKMGANATVCDPHRVLVTGSTPLYGQEITSLDLRAGATLVIAALIAQGETVLHGIEVIDRGYEELDKRLTTLGADIKRITS
jgi:UDP-N-acetylglucosamine 1-carboxyvinyltransferase